MSRLYRLSEDGTEAVILNDGVYSRINVESREVLSVTDRLEGNWVIPSFEDRVNLLSLVAAGISEDRWRRVKAEQQPRDSSGRWVAEGANVRWRSGGQDWSGTVDRIENGQAIVTVNHADGTKTTTAMNPESLKVMTSKARLSSVTKKYFNKSGDLLGYLDKNEKAIEKAAKDGGVIVERPDGYSVEIRSTKPRDGDGDGIIGEVPEEEEDKETSPIIYQLYAPGGRSLGIFNKPGVKEFDSIIAKDSGTNPAPSADVSVVASASPKAYSIPKSVKEAILPTLEDNMNFLDSDSFEFFQTFLDNNSVTLDEIRQLQKYLATVEELYALIGGDSMKNWVSKVEPEEFVDPIQHNFESGIYEYYVTYTNGDTDLLAVDIPNDRVLSWTGADFTLDHGSIYKYDAEIIEPVDELTARKIAYQLHEAYSKGVTASIVAKDAFPIERNLFDLAVKEFDTNYLDEIASLAYSSGQRSLDSQTQPRGEGGTFAAPSLEEYGNVESKYFAIVDEVDKTSVSEVVAIATTEAGPQVFKRIGGEWVPDVDLLASLQSPTPPPVVYLDSENMVNDVLSQVDAYDAGEEPSAEDTEFSVKSEVTALIDSGKVLPEDIHELITKARSFNRMDLIPEPWRAYSGTSSESGLYGEFGEVITASAASQGYTSLQRLENYWLSGEGSAKIDWKSSTAVDYATKTFTKYLGADRALAFAQILKHKSGATA